MRRSETAENVKSSAVAHADALMGPETRRWDDHVGSGFGMIYGASMSHIFVTCLLSVLDYDRLVWADLYEAEDGDEEPALFMWCKPGGRYDRRWRWWYRRS